MSVPTVSIVIPTYNYGRFLEEALNSVLAQTFREFEVIVVDDGSSDDTRQRVEAFGPNIQYIYQPNAGAASARNTGIRHSRGEYIAFLDADDVWLPHKLERQVHLLGANPDAGVAYTWWAFIDEAGNPLPQVKKPSYQGDVLEELLFGCFVTFSMLMVRRACFDQVGLLDPGLKIAEDWDILLRLAGAGYKFAFVPEVLVRNRLHANHLSGDLSRKYEDEHVVLTKALSRITGGTRVDSLRNDAHRVFLIGTAIDHFHGGKTQEGNRLLLDAVCLQPQTLERPGFFLGLALKLVPYGYRSSDELTTRLEAVVQTMVEILQRLFSTPGIPEAVANRRRLAWSNLMLALSVLHWRCRQWMKALAFVVRAFTTHPLNPVVALLGRVLQRLPSVRLLIGEFRRLG